MKNTENKNTQELDYINAIPEMQKIPTEQVQKHNMPISIFIHEAETLFATAQRMKTQLTNTGISNEQINNLKKRAGILRHAQSIWIANYRAKQEDIKNWNLIKTKGFKYQILLRNTFRYAYADDQLLYARVKAIKKATSTINMIQALNDYCEFAKEYPDHLTAINFDLSQIDQIQTLATKLGNLYGKAVDQRKKQHEYKTMRDRAFTLLNQSVRKIRNCGKFIFANRPDIKILFTSDYLRQKNNKSRNINNNNNSNKPTNNNHEDNNIIS